MRSATVGVLLTFALANCVVAHSGKSANDVDRKWLLMMDEEEQLHFVDLTMSFWDIDVNDTQIKFYYHSRKTDETEITFENINELANAEFDPKRETLFIIHGWNNKKSSLINTLIVPATLQTKDWNVFVVDWSEIAYMTYLTASDAVPQVGDIIAKFIKAANEKHGLDISKIHLAGHSLGAHVAGRVGAQLKGKISSIVGMDPAMPRFNYDDVDDRLDPKDAQFVHIIHTNGGFLAFASPLGHADYYPNGGRSQKGCGLDLFGTCAHSRSYKYFAESIRESNFVAIECDSYDDYLDGKCDGKPKSYMGGSILDRRASGSFYLETAGKQPFGLGDNGKKLFLS